MSRSLASLSLLVLATSIAPAHADTEHDGYAVAALGATAGAETYLGLTFALRGGVRWDGDGTRPGFFGECAVTGFKGVGPYNGGASQHCLAAAELTWNRRFHLYGGVALEHLYQEATEHQAGFDQWEPELVPGVGLTSGLLRLDLEVRVPTANLHGDDDITPQFQLTAGMVF